MMNMLDTQDKLKNFSEEQLVAQMQTPSGEVPQFLVLSEIERRKRMRDDAQRQQGMNQTTVAQDAVNAAGVPQGGIADMAQSMAPQTDMTQNTGIMSAAPQKMAGGGVVKMADGLQVQGPLSTLSTIELSRMADNGDDAAINELRRREIAALGGGGISAMIQAPSTVSAITPAQNAEDRTTAELLARAATRDRAAAAAQALQSYVAQNPQDAAAAARLAAAQDEATRAAAAVTEPANAGMDTGTPLATAELPPGYTAPPAPPAPVAQTPSTGGGGGAASSYEQMLMDTLKSREKAREQDKWLSLAEVGMAMMASQSPTLAGAFGEAGLKGAASYKKSRDQYDTDRMNIMGELEQYKQQRAAAQARASGGGAPDFRQGLKDEASILKLAGEYADRAAALREQNSLGGVPNPDVELQAQTLDAKAASFYSMLGDGSGNTGESGVLTLSSATQP